MDQILRLNEFFVEGGKQGLSHVLLHITEPSTPEEAKKGYFFALCEINNGNEIIKKLQDLIDRAENEYYELPDDEEKNAFELVLEKMNQEAFVLGNAEKSLHCIVGAIRQREIIFSFYGSPHLLLFYKNKQGIYERMDLIKNNGETSADEENNKLFSQIVQGKLTSGDYLFAGTPHIVDFFSHDRLEKIITTRTAQESAQHIEKVLGELKNGYSFGGMIINLFQPEVKEIDLKKKAPAGVQGGSQKSLHNLFNREKNTADTLSPSLLPKLNKLRTILDEEPRREATVTTAEMPSAEINSTHLSTRPTKPQSIPLSNRFETVGKISLAIAKVIGKGIIYFATVVFAILYNLFKTLVLLGIVVINYKNRRRTIIENWKHGLHSYKENIKHLPLATKLMLIGSVLLAAGFFVSLVYLRYHQQKVAEEQNFTNLVKDLRAKKDSIESAIIYKNDELAFSEFQLAKQLLAKLTCEEKERKGTCSSLSSQFEEMGQRLRKITEVTPTLLSTWSTTGKPEQLIRVKNKLLAYSDSTSTLFVHDLLSGESKILTTYSNITGFSEAAVPKENDYVIFLYNKNKLVSLDPNDLTLKLIELSFPDNNSNVSSFVIYNRRLYSHDLISGDIFRHDSIKTGFGQGKSWIKDKSRVMQDGVDMAVDGDIFLTRANGSIAKFTSGDFTPFEITGLDPTLQTGSRIWTYTDISYIYILDESGKRLIILEKNGRLVTQISSKDFVKPSGFVVDPTTKTAYIIDSGKLLKVTLP